MDTRDRMKKYLQYKNISEGAFERLAGLSKGFISNIGDSIRAANRLKIEACAPELNIAWLQTGEGNMLNNEELSSSGINSPIKDEKQIENNNIVNSNNNYLLVPVIHVDSVGGMHSANEMSGELQYIEHYVPFVNARNGDIAIYESGNSMIPTIPPGSLIHIRKVEQWKEYIGYGNIYVIELTDGRRLTKEIAKYEPDPKSYVLCRSHNPDVADEELPRSMIVSVWKVISILINKGW